MGMWLYQGKCGLLNDDHAAAHFWLNLVLQGEPEVRAGQPVTGIVNNKMATKAHAVLEEIRAKGLQRQPNSYNKDYVLTQRNLGKDFELRKDPANSYKWYKKIADQRDTIGMYEAGMHLIQGVGVAQNSAHGVMFMTSAAESGLGLACYEMGKWNFLGEDGLPKLPKNYLLAEHWFRIIDEDKFTYGKNGITEEHRSQAKKALEEIDDD